MYLVNRLDHERHGHVIEITREKNGNVLLTPFHAVQTASKERRLWQNEGIKKIRYLLDGQILTSKQLEQWSKEEYSNLPKCFECAQIITDDVFTHNLSDIFRFCSKNCADKNYYEKIEVLKDEEDIDYL